MRADEQREVPVKARLRDAVFVSSARMEVKGVMYALIHRADAATLACWPSIPTIAADAGMHEDTAKKTLDSLVACGAVTRRNRARDDGSATSPEWTIHEPELLARLNSIPKDRRGGNGGAKLPPTRGETSPHLGRNYTPPPGGGDIGPGWGETSPRGGAELRPGVGRNFGEEYDHGTRSGNPAREHDQNPPNPPEVGAGGAGEFKSLRHEELAPAATPPQSAPPVVLCLWERWHAAHVRVLGTPASESLAEFDEKARRCLSLASKKTGTLEAAAEAICDAIAAYMRWCLEQGRSQARFASFAHDRDRWLTAAKRGIDLSGYIGTEVAKLCESWDRLVGPAVAAAEPLAVKAAGMRKAVENCRYSFTINDARGSSRGWAATGLLAGEAMRLYVADAKETGQPPSAAQFGESVHRWKANAEAARRRSAAASVRTARRRGGA